MRGARALDGEEAFWKARLGNTAAWLTNAEAHRRDRNQKEGRRSFRQPSSAPSGYFFPLPIWNIFVPQVAHVPLIAGLPFFMVTAVGSFISVFALHFTQ